MSDAKKPGLLGRLFGLGKGQPPASEPARERPEPLAPTPAITSDDRGQKPERDNKPEATREDVVGRFVPADVPLVDVQPPADPPPSVPRPLPEAAPEPPLSWWHRLRDGLARTADGVGDGITGVFTKRKLDAGAIQDLEDILIQADLGLAASARMAAAVGKDRYDREVSPDEVKEILAREIEASMRPVALPIALDDTRKPFVVLMVGVNGSGKTTTIGKLAAKFRADGKEVMLAAGDTFRAAAIEQLRVWGERTGCAVLAREQGADAASLAFDALRNAELLGTDILLMDTAGRLQNRTELMGELDKIVRVMRKVDASAPHAVILVLDATVGQNALQQVEIFGKIAGVTGLIMTKLDGTARGGILVAIADRFGLPVHYIGVGESIEDLEAFEARDYARAVVGMRDR